MTARIVPGRRAAALAVAARRLAAAALVVSGPLMSAAWGSLWLPDGGETEPAAMLIFLVGTCLLLVGLGGVYLRQRLGAGRRGGLGYALVVTGALMTPTFWLTVPGLLLAAIGLILLGVATARAGVFPAGAGWALVAAVPVTTALVSVLGDSAQGERHALVAAALLVVSFSAPFVWLGSALFVGRAGDRKAAP